MGRLLGVLLTTLLVAGCTPSWEESGPDDDAPAGPGNEPWSQDENVSCATDDDCGPGEVCENNVCQMKRCYESYVSAPPLGDQRYFGTDGELAILSDKSFIDGFEGADGEYLGSWDLDGATVVDVAGGNMDGARPHGIAVAVAASDQVRLNQSNGDSSIDVGIVPIAIATGDVDADGRDELLAFSIDGHISLCDVELDSCQGAMIEGANGKDVAVADVDGDGRAEPVFLFDLGGESTVIVWNLDAEESGQEESYGWTFNIAPRAMAAGDLDGDRVAEIVMLEDGGWWDWADDKLHVFSAKSEAFVGPERGVNGHSRDVAVGDRNSDEISEIGILREDHKMELFAQGDGGSLNSVMVADVTVGESAERLAMLDWDGDSAALSLAEGPELVTGDVVPTSVYLFPPYHKDIHTDVPWIIVGNSDVQSTSTSETVSLSLGLSVGFGAELGIFKAKVGASIEHEVSVTHSLSSSLSVGQGFYAGADPAHHGDDYGLVTISCGCYYRYRYQADDPAGYVGGSGQLVDIYVPVGGQTVALSSKRYNAMAEALGNLPLIDIPYRLGDVASYPTSPVRLDGAPIPVADNVFPDVPAYQISDAADTAFWLSASESETNETSTSVTLGLNSSFGLGGLEVDFDQGIGFSQGSSISVGTEASFSGNVASIPDDNATPEDEFALYRYTFTPHVYRHGYVDAHGDDAAFYVLTYSAGQ